MKLLIMGYSGAGKSTLAKQLGKQYGYPVLHLDAVNFERNWVEQDGIVANEIVRDFCRNSCYIIDGNYRKLYPKRYDEATKIIFSSVLNKPGSDRERIVERLGRIWATGVSKNSMVSLRGGFYQRGGTRKNITLFSRNIRIN